jgi:hypothetical protein
LRDLVARPHPDTTYFPSRPAHRPEETFVFADAKQTTWRLERPFVLPTGIACAPTTVSAVPAGLRMPFDGVQAHRHPTPGVVPG